jgi:FkbM family methyltransferase
MALSTFLLSARTLGLRQAILLTASRKRLARFLPRWTQKLSVKGHPFYFRHGTTDKYVIAEVLAGAQYDSICHLPDVRTIVDAGANIGTSTVTLLNAYPGATVVAIEPDPGNFAVLQKNVQPYGKRAVPIRRALWNDTERLTIERGAFRDGGNWSFQVRSKSESDQYEVDGITVPALMNEFGLQSIDIFKIDIEAAERHIFDRSSAEWIPNVRYIAIELHDSECRQRFLAAVSQFNAISRQFGEVTVWQRQ